MITKDAIQHLQESGIAPKDRIIEKDGRLFTIDSIGRALELLKPENRIIQAHGRMFEIDDKNNLTELPYREQRIANKQLVLHTLTGLIDYIKSNGDRVNESLYLHVVNEKVIELTGKLNADGNRESLATVKAIVPEFRFDTFYDSERLNIALQSVFLNNKDREILLKVIGNIVEENTKTVGDNGVSQSVVIKTGTTSKAEVKVPNPVTLAPYRTFVEVKQPESRYVFRMRDGGDGALFEADGGVWCNDAIGNIKQYLAEKLTDEIESGRITILA